MTCYVPFEPGLCVLPLCAERFAEQLRAAHEPPCESWIAGDTHWGCFQSIKLAVTVKHNLNRYILCLFVHLWFSQVLQPKIFMMACHIADECFLGSQHETELFSLHNKCQLLSTLWWLWHKSGIYRIIVTYLGKSWWFSFLIYSYNIL